MILLKPSGPVFFFFSFWWWLCKPIGSIFSLAKILPSWPLGCPLLHVHVHQQQAVQQVPHLTTQSTWVMFLRTPWTQIPKQLIILFGSKGDRFHSQSSQHYQQKIGATSQPTALPDPSGHTLPEGKAWQSSFNSQHSCLLAERPGQVPPTPSAYL